MVFDISTRLLKLINESRVLYHRLIFLVGDPGAGKTKILESLSEGADIPKMNVGLSFSKALLDLTPSERGFRASGLFQDMVLDLCDKNDGTPETVLLDNIEILFEPSLELNVFQLLKTLSKHRTLVVAFSGSLEDGFLSYAKPHHAEYQRCPAEGLMIVAVTKESA